MAPTRMETISAPIEFELDREGRKARLSIGKLAEVRVEPIRNPVTGLEHHARINLPNGFEYNLAEMGNTVSAVIDLAEPLNLRLDNSYAQWRRSIGAVCRPDRLARRPRSLLVRSIHLGLADVRAFGIELSLPQRAALAEQVPALVEAHLDLLELGERPTRSPGPATRPSTAHVPRPPNVRSADESGCRPRSLRSSRDVSAGYRMRMII